MKKIKSVMVAGFEYRIIWDYQFQDESERQEGIADHDKMIIHISKNLTDQRKQEVLLHELLHCIDYQYNAAVKKISEPTMRGLGIGLYQVLKDNDLGIE